MFRSKRKNQAPITKFWEEKLDLDFNAEIEYYRKLCGHSYKRKVLCKNLSKSPDMQFDLQSQYLSYGKWKIHILNSVNNLSIEELKIYLLFLNQQYRNSSRIFSTYQTVMTPFAIFLLTFISNIFNIFNDGYDKATLIISNVLFYIMVLNVLKNFFSIDDDINKNFYQDVINIIDEKINQIK